MNGSWQVVLDENEEEDPRRPRSADLRRAGGLAVVILVVAASTASAMLDQSTIELFPPLGASIGCNPRGVSSPTGSMNFARSGHTATLLRSGKVLVAGGWGPLDIKDLSGSLTVTASAELYDPTTGTWSVTGSMKSARAFHAAVLLPSGKVLVAGGRALGGTDGFESITSAELYDPVTGKWRETGGMRAGGDFLAAIVLRSGKVFVSGGGVAPGFIGYPGPTREAELYDPASGRWYATGGLVDPFGSATLLVSGNVLVLGGAQRPQMYDPVTGGWKPAGQMIAIREWHTATLLPSGKVLVAGGDVTYPHPISSAEIYDPVTDMWTPTRSMTTQTLAANATLLQSGEVLVAGGGTGPDRMGPRASIDLYDPATATWTAPGAMAAPRSYFTATLLRSGAVLFAGGEGISYADQYPYASAEIYALTCPSR